MSLRAAAFAALMIAAGLSAPPAGAQMPMDHHHDMPGMSPAPDAATPEPTDHASMPGMSMATMRGMFGPEAMSREASGTSWQPQSTLVEGIHGSYDGWSTMVHGFANGVYDQQGGRRGDTKAFSESMLMGMAWRPLGIGTLGLRGMVSLDPLMGRNGYPEILQTGETANGRTALVDRQHPHDFFMELAASYSIALAADRAVFGYVGLPGEPALGPPTYMHRFSGIDNPEAPLLHHWLDSTHVSMGVMTVGYIHDRFKLEASAFRGREPDQHRWDIESPNLDSGSVRLSFNPTEDWALQVSYGHLASPELLQPRLDENRFTASASYNRRLDEHSNWQTTIAWGQRDFAPGHTLDGVLLESALLLDNTHTVFGRAERVANDELFAVPESRAGRVFTVNKLSLGYIYDIPLLEHLKAGAGGLVSVYALPNALDSAYGSNPVSFMAFIRAKLY
jgi:hypothetical protein